MTRLVSMIFKSQIHKNKEGAPLDSIMKVFAYFMNFYLLFTRSWAPPSPPASRPLFDERIYRFSGWHHHFIWQVVLSFLEFKEKRPSPFWENGVFRFCPESPLRPHLALNRTFVISTWLGQPRWLVIGGKWIKLSWAHGKWPIWHYFNPRGLSFGPPKGP